ncbi:MAG: nucleoside hydrolase [Lachnospiraceae bacterium]|nr:nucleoside hydrolase [Lachnospiraceae bacterium]
MLTHPIKNPTAKRVIISTDAACEVDDLFAIAQTLLSPTLDVKGIAAAHFLTPGSMEESREEILKLLSCMGLSDRIPVLSGSPVPMSREDVPEPSEAARFIIEEAHRDGPPLYITVQGAATDVSSAFLMDPTISQGIAGVLWLGGAKYPEGGSEFNLQNDQAAGNALMDSTLPLWQIPLDASTVIKPSYYEILLKVKPYGTLGKYLCDRYEWVLRIAEGAPRETWTLCDMAAPGLLLDDHDQVYTVRNAPRFLPDMRYEETDRVHPIRVYGPLNARFIMEDFYCKLQLFSKE